MKRILKRIFVLLISIFMLTGCALYGSVKQYDEKEGDFYWLTGSSEVARIKQDKLALEKLKSQPVQTASINGATIGYQGMVANLSKNKTYNFVITGPEVKSFLSGPSEIYSDNLIPGTYACKVYQNGIQIGEAWIFHVGPRQSYFKGKKVHWYCYMDQ